MTTLLEAPEPATRPSPTSATPTLVSVRANLMPDAVISARQTETVRRRVLIALVGIVALIIAGYGASWLQTQSAHSDLDSLNHQNSALLAQQSSFAPLVAAQRDAGAVSAQLKSLMTNDLSWQKMLATLRSLAPAGVTLTNVTGTVNSTTGAAAGAAQAPNPLVAAGVLPTGTLTLTGTAGNKNAVAAYSDKLGKASGLTGVLITNVAAGTASGVTFTITATITSAALGGRFTPRTTTTVAPTGGK